MPAQEIVIISAPSDTEVNNLMQLLDERETAKNRWLVLKQEYYAPATAETTPRTRAMWWIIKKAEDQMLEAIARYDAAFETFTRHWGY